MSKTFKMVLVIAVVLIVAAGLYYWFMNPGGSEILPPSDMNSATQSSATLPSGNDTSNVSLTQDMKAIDAQMNSFVSDDASVDASVSDQSGEQSAL